jgi:hypothetical protein
MESAKEIELSATADSDFAEKMRAAKTAQFAAMGQRLKEIAAGAV